jgi:hypothetical protein
MDSSAAAVTEPSPVWPPPSRPTGREDVPLMSPFVHGVTKINEHCTFEWWEPEGRSDERDRTYAIGPQHCEACIAELRRTSAPVTFARGTKAPGATAPLGGGDGRGRPGSPERRGRGRRR